MNIFKNYTYSWWQIGILKLSLLAFGVAIGAYWQEFFSQYISALATIGVVSGIYMIAVSLKNR